MAAFCKNECVAITVKSDNLPKILNSVIINHPHCTDFLSSVDHENIK